jgi:hypothetical protein
VNDVEENIIVREVHGEDASVVARLYRQLVSTVAPDKHVDVLKERLAESALTRTTFFGSWNEAAMLLEPRS